MFGSAVSRWTALHFAIALGAFAAAQALMAGGVAYPATPLLGPTTLVAVHLLTIGWLTLLILGALHQFVPVITGGSKATGWPALMSLLAIVAGLGAMEMGFLALEGVFARQAISLLPAGGTLVLVGAALGAAPLARTLWSARPLAFSARFVSLGLVFLLATIGLGIAFALVFAFPGAFQWAAMPAGGLRLHVLSGLLGWFTLTAMGVSYRLLSMFTLAPEERGALGNAVLWLSAGGLAAAWLLDAIDASGQSVPGALDAVAHATLALGAALYLLDMARMLRARRRLMLELNATMAIAALTALGVCLAAAVLATITGRLGALAGPLGYLFIFGWLSGLGLSQLYKIIPFVTWLERYGGLLGKQTVPRVQDLVDEPRDRPWFVLYFVAVTAGTLCAAFGWTLEWRIAIGGHLVATLMIARALWLARRGKPRLAQPRAAALGGNQSLRTSGS